MVAELQAEIEAMKVRLGKAEKGNAELKDEMESNQMAYFSKIQTIEDKLQEVDAAKTNLLDQIGPQFVALQVQADILVSDARKRFEEHDQKIGMLMITANKKFDEAEVQTNLMNDKINTVYHAADQRLREITEALNHVQGGGQASGNGKKIGLLPDKMMVPKVYNNDIMMWNKWKDDVAKYFDETKEGLKYVMEEVAALKDPVTVEVLRSVAQRFPQVSSTVEQWKHLFRALEKLTEGESAKILSTVKEKRI